jgi:peptide chain release factor 1
VQTSTVTVAVIDPNKNVEHPSLKRDENDFKLEWYSGSGSGGQHRNKHQNSCRITHIPTGVVKTAQTRNRQSSEKEARQSLLTHLDSMYHQAKRTTFDSDRKGQVGSGMRGDKIRTYRFQDDRVEDHQTGRGASCKKVMGGNFENLW